MSDLEEGITQDKKQRPKAKQTETDQKDLFMDSLKALMVAIRDGDDDEAKKSNAVSAICKFIEHKINESPVRQKYNIIIHYDNTTLLKSDADEIYASVTQFTEKKPILMILQSYGGEIGAAYLIGKLCREYSDGKFIVAIPRMAKSAATLLSCAADEIHMGSMSELGPIDPQIKDMPALGLKNSIEHIAQLVSQNPDSSNMFAKYLTDTVRPIDIGYNERVAESAAQYADRLLATHRGNLEKSSADVAHTLVYTYKDHSFVIDKSEAVQIFGDKIIKVNTDEYNISNLIYGYLKAFKELCSAFNYAFVYIGNLSNGVKLIKRR